MRTPVLVITAAVGGILATIGMSVATLIMATLYVMITHPENTLPPCATEDSVSCYWDAGTRGNGKGRSFWADGSGRPHYVP